MPTLELFRDSLRFDSDLDYRAAQWLHPWNRLQALAPYLFRQRVFQVDVPNPIEQSFYFGAAFPIAAAWLFARRGALDGRARWLLAILGGACATSLLLAFGRHAGLHRLVASLPWIGQLRVPARHTLLLHLAAAVVIALAFADLARAVGRRDDARRSAAPWLWLMPASSALVAVIALALPHFSALSPELSNQLASWGAIGVGPALSILCAGIFHAAARGGRAALAGLVLFIAADQAAYGVSLWWTVPPQTIAQFVDSVPRPPERFKGRLALGFSDRISVDQEGRVLFFASTRLLVHDARLVWGYAGITPARRLHPYAPKTLEIAGVSLVRQNAAMVPLPDPLPRFRLVSDVRVAGELERALQEVDVRATALVETPVVVEPGPAGSVEVRRELPGAIRLRVRAPTRQLLVVSESFHSGWKFAVDSSPAPVLRVYGDFMGTPIEPGSHEVELRFHPASLELGRALSASGLLLLAAGACAGRRTGSSARSGKPATG